MDEDRFTDTAGAIPSNGVVVRGLRTMVVSRPRDLTPASLLRSFFWRWDTTEWHDVVVEQAGTGARVAELRCTSRRRARAARSRFVEAARAMSDEEAASTDWAELLERAARQA